jgi:hypothetical protein
LTLPTSFSLTSKMRSILISYTMQIRLLLFNLAMLCPVAEKKLPRFLKATDA